MKTYSSFFKTLHDEQAPTGYLGRGIHYSILRAVVFHDEIGRPCLGSDFDFAVIWEEDHDDRVVQAIEQCYRRRILSSFFGFQEAKGILTGFVAPGLSKCRISFVESQLHAIAEEEVELDVWTSVIATVEEPHGIGSCPDENLSLYINNLRMLWRLGPARKASNSGACFGTTGGACSAASAGSHAKVAKRKQTWLGASTYRRQRSAVWQRPALSRQAWSPREKGRRKKEPKIPPAVPPCSQASAKLRSPVTALFGKIAEGHAEG
jgi:hypothetical protein